MMQVNRTKVENIINVNVTDGRYNKKVTLCIRKDMFESDHLALMTAELRLNKAETRRLIAALKAQLKRIK